MDGNGISLIRMSSTDCTFLGLSFCLEIDGAVIGADTGNGAVGVDIGGSMAAIDIIIEHIFKNVYN